MVGAETLSSQFPKPSQSQTKTKNKKGKRRHCSYHEVSYPVPV
jgi:hypothetical protein